MSDQLRQYVVKPGCMDEFLQLFSEHVVPARRLFGMEVVGAWVDRDGDRFTWVVRVDGDFAAADAAYYSSAERAALPTDPKDLLADVQTAMYEPYAW